MALQTVPIQSLVDQIKRFIPMFIDKLESELYQNQVYITWQFGGLHYSDVVEIYSPLTSSKDIYLPRLSAIKYLGRGTFTDCAISNMTQQIQTQMANGVNFAVVITDGHVTGSPCGGMKMQAEKARDMGIKLFAVAPSEKVYEQGLREIANLPHELYRNNYAITQRDTLEIDVNTIDRIIQAMVRAGGVTGGTRGAAHGWGNAFPFCWVLEITPSRESGAFFWFFARTPWFVPLFPIMSGQAATLVLAPAEDQAISQPAPHPGACGRVCHTETRAHHQHAL